MKTTTNRRFTGELDVKVFGTATNGFMTGCDSDSILEWCLSVTHEAPKHILIPFFPYSRADRKINFTDAEGDVGYEPNGCLMMCKLLRAFAPNAEITTYDAHNPRVLEMFGIKNEWPVRLWNHAIKCEINDLGVAHYAALAIAPDYGANERCKAFALYTEMPMITCSKSRTVDNSKVEVSIPNPEQIRDKNCFVVDDIWDGGRTFIDLAAKLKAAGAARVVLVITHGIFSNGFNLGGDIDKMYTLGHMLNGRTPDSDKIKIF
jgi:ribose-phosphate pyrophosphokinase